MCEKMGIANKPLPDEYVIRCAVKLRQKQEATGAGTPKLSLESFLCVSCILAP